MSQTLAEMLTWSVTAYSLLGVAFAVAFVSLGVGRIDPLARSAPWTFRALILPGAVVFWPLLLVRWASGSIAPPVELTAHRRRARQR
jgi:hypothetical protein